jgi:hypothetical protein
MFELEALLRLSWIVAAAAPTTAPTVATVPTATPLAPGRISLFAPEMPVLARMQDAPQIPNNPALTDTWFFGLGTTFMTSNTQAQLNGTSGAGVVIDFEEAFGLAKSEWAPEGLARWRFSERWRLEFEYFSLNRSNSRTTQQDVTWGDTTIPAGTTVKGNFDVTVLRLSCGYSFFKTQDKEIGVALGFHVTRFEAGVDATGFATEDAKVLAPLPVLSVYGQFALTDEWSVQGRLDALRLEYDPFYGSILSVGVDALYQPWRHLGFGIGWRTLQIEGGVEADDWSGDLNTNYTGPIVFISSSF